MRTKSFTAGMLLVSVLSVASPDHTYSDAQREARIRGDLAHLHIEDLDVEVLGWGVTLTGTVECLAQSRAATKYAMNAPDIKEVFNDLQVVRVPDDALRNAILAALEKDRRHYTVYDAVTVSVEDGHVFLSGHAIDADAAAAIAHSIAKVRGVSAIDNAIDTTPMSPEDEALQTSLVFTINRALTPYLNAHPSVHVMVKDGHVWLRGFVEGHEARSAVERAVMTADGVVSVENELRGRS